MTTATLSNVAKLYIAFFKRAPDRDGLNYWVYQAGLSLEQITQSFFDQPETQAKYAGADDRAFIESIYQNVLGRAGEEDGVLYWLNELQVGHISRDYMILAVTNGAQGADGMLLESRTEVGLYYAERGGDYPDAFMVIEETLGAEYVQEVKDWIDDRLPNGGVFDVVLRYADVDYDFTGTPRDDVYPVEEFRTARINAGDGSDTLDFTDYRTAGISVNLAEGTGPDGMTFQSVENIRATSGKDILVGNAEKNIILAMGGGDVVDGKAGDDRIMFLNMADVAAALINGGEGSDILEITDQTSISVGANTFANVTGVEILQIGYTEEVVTQATTLTVTDGSPLRAFHEIRGTESIDRKGVATNDVIQSAVNMDLRGIHLSSIEGLRALADGVVIRLDSSELAGLKAISGVEGGKAYLYVYGDNLTDISSIKFSNLEIFYSQMLQADWIDESVISGVGWDVGLS